MPPIKWEDPPHAGDSRASYRALAEELKKNPGKWGIVRVAESSVITVSYAMTIKLGKAKVWQPAGSFEAVSRKIDGEYRVYARYIGQAAS